MNCREVKQWIGPYLDSELDPKTTFQVSQHLESCDKCRVRFERERQADTLIASALKRHEPGMDWASIERALRQPRSRRLWRPAGILAAAAGIALMIILVGWPRELNASPAQWAVDELNRIRPDDDPFASDAPYDLGELSSLSRKILEQDFPIELPAEEDGGVRVIDVQRRVGPNGHPRVEVRLNCCGSPVLLTAARPDHLGELHDVGKELQGTGRWKHTALCNGKEYHVSAIRHGNLVLVAVSPKPHAPGHIFGAH